MSAQCCEDQMACLKICRVQRGVLWLSCGYQLALQESGGKLAPDLVQKNCTSIKGGGLKVLNVRDWIAVGLGDFI